jgi:hypothetical protein
MGARDIVARDDAHRRASADAVGIKRPIRLCGGGLWEPSFLLRLTLHPDG